MNFKQFILVTILYVTMVGGYGLLGTHSEWGTVYEAIGDCQGRWSIDPGSLPMCPLYAECRDCMFWLFAQAPVMILYAGVMWGGTLAFGYHMLYELVKSIRKLDIETVGYPIFLLGAGMYLAHSVSTSYVIDLDDLFMVFVVLFATAGIAMICVGIAKHIKGKKPPRHDNVYDSLYQNNIIDQYTDKELEDAIDSTGKLLDHYAILNVSEDATPWEIRDNFVSLVKAAHPDKPGGTDDAMIRLHKAYEVLRDADRRRTYDELLRIGRNDGAL